MSDGLLVVIVLVALGFDFTNGFHDTANAVATSVSTRALSPRVAVAIAAIMNFVGAFTSTKVAQTVGDGLINTDQGRVTGHLILAALFGAIAWNLFTWRLGLPSSSSHALVGGLVGAALAAGGPDPVQWDGIWNKVVWPGLASPVIGFVIAGAIMVGILWLFRRVRPAPLNRGFRLAQVASGSFMAFAHGTNDAQKTMGVIVLTLVASDRLAPDAGVPTWVKVTCAVAVALGTWSGGWRVIRTLGTKVTDVTAPQGFSAETASSTTILASSYFGFSLSTTQVVSGGVMGTGLARPGHAVNWPVVKRMVSAWLVTLPAAGLVGAVSEEIVDHSPSDAVGCFFVALVASLVLAY
ncbi:MAG: inorganic phosphate transporter, partial [Gaiellales bacterium]